MRGFLALVRKEFRDGVAPLGMSALLAAVLSWTVDGDVMLRDADGKPLRRLFPPATESAR